MAAKCEMCESLSATHVEAVTQQLHADVRVVARPIALWRETSPGCHSLQCDGQSSARGNQRVCNGLDYEWRPHHHRHLAHHVGHVRVDRGLPDAQWGAEL